MKFAAKTGMFACAAVAFAFALPVQASAAPAQGQCHASYDPCLPIVSDVDCKGGGGNGPVYTGRVRVIGPDEYGLDKDGDGIGCDNS